MNRKAVNENTRKLAMPGKHSRFLKNRLRPGRPAKFLYILLFLFFLFFPGRPSSLAKAQDLSAEEVSRRLEARLKSITSLRAEFKQYYYSAGVQEPMTGKGQVFIRRPNRMRWEYNSPEKQIFLLKDRNFWLYFPEDKQLIKNAAESDLLESEVLGLLAGSFSLLERYRIEFNPFPSGRQNAYQLRLLPLVQDQFTYILLEIDRRTWLITKAIFFEPTGGKLEYQFSRISLGQKLSEELFQLNLPADCEIIEAGSIK